MPTIKEILQTMDYGPAPESTKEAQAWLESHGRRFGLFVDGAWTDAADTFGSFNPADGC
jgi:aldehyde dehydrogenase (NAD+)